MNKIIIMSALFLSSNFNLVNAQGAGALPDERIINNLIEAEIIKAWEKHNSFNLLILNSLADDHLKSYSASKGRNVGEQFAHIHETRINWLTDIAPEAAKNLNKISSEKISTVSLKENLIASADAVKIALQKGLREGKLNGYPNHPINFYTYLVSHESHHRGQILLSLKQSGYEAKPQVSYGIWNW